MRFESKWLWQGHFDFSHQNRRETTTQAIRETLTQRLGLGAKGLQIAQYPVGPQFKHTYWWREGKRDYAEAQFFARVSGAHPVLSLGVSVEKGLEATAKPGTQRMDRKSWDWTRLLKHATRVFTEDALASAAKCARPILVRVVSHRPSREETPRLSRTFVLLDGQWRARRGGFVDAKDMVTYVRQLDQKRDWWVVVYIGSDWSPSEIEGMEPAQAAEILMCFANVRERLRK